MSKATLDAEAILRRATPPGYIADNTYCHDEGSGDGERNTDSGASDDVVDCVQRAPTIAADLVFGLLTPRNRRTKLSRGCRSSVERFTWRSSLALHPCGCRDLGSAAGSEVAPFGFYLVGGKGGWRR